MTVRLTEIRPALRNSTEPAAKGNPARTSRVPATGAIGRNKGLLLSSTWVSCYHLGLKIANAGDMMEMEVPATNTRRLVRRSTMEPAAKDNPAPTLRVPATGATGKKEGLLLSYDMGISLPSRSENCHCWRYDGNGGPCNEYEETCKEKYNGTCSQGQPGPGFESTGYWCNR